jgi:hypothetical protein
MHNYIIETMAHNGCGLEDTRIIETIAATLPHIAWDTLDAMDSFGPDTSLTEAGNAARNELEADYDDDTLICLAAYVGAYRNVIGAYAN